MSNAENLARLATALLADSSKNLTAANTPPQFGADKGLATTEFVQRALGNHRSAYARYGDQVLEVADIGAHIVAGDDTADRSYTMPPDSVQNGASIKITNLSGRIITLAQRVASDRFIGAHNYQGTATSFAIVDGATVVATKYGPNMWLVTGSADESYGPLFSKLLAGNGFQKFPGGLILQWGGTTVTSGAANVAGTQAGTFPTPFPTQVLFTSAYHNSVDSAYLNSSIAASSNSAFTVSLISSAASLTRTVRWIALGF